MITKIKTNDRDEWLGVRKLYIGGSDAASVVGLNPYKGSYALWAEKRGMVEPFGGSITTDVGTFLEEFVAKKFEVETGKKVRRERHTLVNDAYPFACADVDRMIVGENALLECKTTNSAPAMRKFTKGEYPETWYCQMMHYLAVTGRQTAYLAVLIRCSEFKVFTLERDEDEISALMDAEKAFMQMVEDGTPPQMSGCESDTDAVNAVFAYADSSKTTADLTGDINTLQQYKYAVQAVKEAEKTRDALAQTIKAILGDCTEGQADGYHVTWKEQTRSTFDRKALEKDFPSIDVGRYMKVSSSRVFKFSAD